MWCWLPIRFGQWENLHATRYWRVLQCLWESKISLTSKCCSPSTINGLGTGERLASGERTPQVSTDYNEKWGEPCEGTWTGLILLYSTVTRLMMPYKLRFQLFRTLQWLQAACGKVHPIPYIILLWLSFLICLTFVRLYGFSKCLTDWPDVL